MAKLGPLSYPLYKKSALAAIQTSEADVFFKNLDRVKAKIFSESDKRAIAEIYWELAIPASKGSMDLSPEAFMAALIQLKTEVGFSFFNKLIQPEALDTSNRMSELESLTQSLMGLSQRPDFDFVTFTEAQTRGTLNWKVLRETLRKLDGEAVPKTLREPELDRILRDFRTPSDFLKFPLMPKAMDQVEGEYREFVKQVEAHFSLSLGELQRQLTAFKDRGLSLSRLSSVEKTELLSLLALVAYRVLGQFPYATQVLSILGLLESGKGRLAQIRTGEGKSLTMGLLAAFLACLEIQVHVMTSSKDLAIRDAEEFRDFFAAMGLSTFHVCQDGEERAGADKYSQNILYGTAFYFSVIFLQDALSAPVDRKIPPEDSLHPRIMLVDEVDNMMIDTAGNSTRIATPTDTFQALRWIYPAVLDFVKTLKADDEVTKTRVAELQEFLRCYEEGKYASHSIIGSAAILGTWLESAKTAYFDRHRDTHYVVEGEALKIADKNNTGAISQGTRWSKGIHQFLEIKEGLPMHAEDATIASLSNLSLLKIYYRQVYGLSGTLGGTVERAELQALYGTDSFDVPTYRPCLRKFESPLILETVEARNLRANSMIAIAVRAGRPVLVFLESIAETWAFSEFLKKRSVVHQVLNDRQIEDKTAVVRLAGQSGMVTVATNIASRGTDFKLSPQSLAAGGLLILKLRYSSNKRVDEQINGRGCRQGQPGCVREIFSLEDERIQQLFPDASKRMALLTKPNFLEKLDERRERNLQLQSFSRRTQADIELGMHEIFRRFSALLTLILAEYERMDLRALAERLVILSRAEFSEEIVPAGSSVLFAVQIRLNTLLKQESPKAAEILTGLVAYREALIELFKRSWANDFSQLELVSQSIYGRSENSEAFLEMLLGRVFSSGLYRSKKFALGEFQRELENLIGLKTPIFSTPMLNQKMLGWSDWRYEIKSHADPARFYQEGAGAPH